jgi:hypothetical protein
MYNSKKLQPSWSVIDSNVPYKGDIIANQFLTLWYYFKKGQLGQILIICKVHDWMICFESIYEKYTFLLVFSDQQIKIRMSFM